MTRGKKILVGCLATVGIMVLTVILSVVLMVSWFKTPGPGLEASRLVHEQTTLYVELRLRRDDQAVRDLLRDFLEGRNRNASAELAEGIPPAMEKFLPLFQQLAAGDVKEKDLDKALPLTVILTSEKDGSGMMQALFAVNFPAGGHTLILADWLLPWTIGKNDEDLVVRWHGDEALYRFNSEPPVWATIVDTGVLVSTSEEAVLSGIERLRRPPATIPASPLQAILEELPADAALTLVAQDGGAGTLLELTAEHLPALGDLLRQKMNPDARVSAWARLESRTRLSGTLLVTGSAVTPSQIPQAEELSTFTLELLDGTVQLKLADKGIDRDGRHEWDFTLEGLPALAQWAATRSGGMTFSIRP